MDPKRMNNADFITSIVLLVFGITVMAMSAAMPDLSEKGINPYTAPGVVPFFLGAVIALLAAILLVRSISRGGWNLAEASRSLPATLKSESFRRLIAVAALTLAYGAILVGRVDYRVSTALFVFAFIFVFEFRRGMETKALRRLIIAAVAESAAVTVCVVLVFQYLFLVDLP